SAPRRQAGGIAVCHAVLRANPRFNPPPADRRGESLGSQLGIGWWRRFNPPPADRRGESEVAPERPRNTPVSIRPPPTGGGNPAKLTADPPLELFQSAPRRQAGGIRLFANPYKAWYSDACSASRIAAEGTVPCGLMRQRHKAFSCHGLRR